MYCNFLQVYKQNQAITDKITDIIQHFIMMKSQESFQSSQSFINSQKRSENQILNEYKQVKYGQESVCFSVEQIEYSSLPDGLPIEFYENFKRGIFIDCSSFYEMLTFALFQHLLRDIDDDKIRRLNKLKNLICTNSFLQFASYIKGLLLLGLQKMIQNSNDLTKPIANMLIGSEKMAAFKQCWKEVLQKFSEYNDVSNEEINSQAIRIFSSFLNIDFHLYSQKQGRLELQIISCKNKKGLKNLVITVLLTNNFQANFLDQDFDKKADISEISSIYGNWSYFIFLNQPQNNDSQSTEKEKIQIRNKPHSFRLRKQRTILRDFTDLFSINEQKSQLDLTLGMRTKIKYTSKDFFKRGQKFLAQMQDFISSLQYK